ncbi:hypothetical protein [Candidatus Accumulibacter aalborgensis]|nr:hypothetical protein [Candidatus Accumulibacter aalborgensis]
MTLTWREFERQLQPLLAGWSVAQVAEGWRLQQQDRTVDICCQTLPVLQIGAFHLPRLAVSIVFSGGRPEENADFIEDFMRYFRRGGG